MTSLDLVFVEHHTKQNNMASSGGDKPMAACVETKDNIVVKADTMESKQNMASSGAKQHNMASSEDELDQATKALTIQDIRGVEDMEWEEIHSRVVRFREEHKMTISSFLQYCGLDNRPYFQQLCCRTGNKKNPSRRQNSVGAFFLNKIGCILDGSFRDDFQSESTSMFDHVEGWFQDNRIQLKDSGIVNLNISIFKPKSIEIVVRGTCTMENAELFEMLRADERMKTEITNDFVIERITSTPCSFSPACIVGHEGTKIGTCTALDIHGKILALTCGHVIGGEDDYASYDKNVSFKPKKDEITSKYRLDGSEEQFGEVALRHQSCDFALISPLPLLSLVLNNVGVLKNR
jgi:hypothetical protein